MPISGTQEVKPFYDFWSSFCTAKSYVWVEEHDTREAPRYARRIMEAENKKKRDAAKKERNEQIRVRSSELFK